jgi:protein-disulfide isomerase
MNSNLKSRKSFLPATLGTVTAIAVGVLVACSDSAKAKPNFVHKEPTKAGVVAKINGEEITEDMLIGEDKLDFFELKKREYELRMDRLNKLLVDKLVGAEAKKAGMSLQDYTDKKITGGKIKISDKDYNKFVKDKRIPESQINPQIKERIMSYLEQQKKQDMVDAYVAKLTKGSPVEVYFNKPKMSVNVDIAGAPAFGKDGAKVTIVEFSDFQCPFCSRGADVVTELKKKYGSKIKVAFKHFPLPMHREARPASEASMCVNEQSADKFWKYHDLVFKNQDKLDDASLAKYAKDVGADAKKFEDCYKSGKYKEAVQKDLDYGEKIGVKSTPTFFVNGQLIAGAVPIESFSEIIDEELNSK